MTPNRNPRRPSQRLALASALLMAGYGCWANEAPAPRDQMDTVPPDNAPLVRRDTLPSGVVVVTTSTPDAPPGGAVETLVETAWIGARDPAGAEPLGQVTAVTADVQGRIYVADSYARCIYVFDRTGMHIRTLGRPGQGPGEFARPYGLAWANNSRLWAMDSALGRMVVFDTAGEHVADYRRPAIGFSTPWTGRFDEGRLVKLAIRGGDQNHLVGLSVAGGLTVSADFSDPTHGIPPQVHVPHYMIRSPTTVRYQAIPYAPRYHWVLDGQGGYWVGWSGEYRLLHQTLTGDTLLILARTQASRAPVTAAERAIAIEELGWTEGVDLSLIPDQKPFFSELAVTPAGDLWVFRDMAESTWVADIYSPSGDFRATLALPYAPTPELRPYIDDSQIVLGTRGVLGVPIVVRLARQGRSPTRARDETGPQQ